MALRGASLLELVAFQEESEMAGIYRRGRIWWARTQRNGREYRQSLKTASRNVALKRFKEWEENVSAFAHGFKVRRSYQDAMYHFLTSHVPNLKPKSQARYRTSAKKLTSQFENYDLHQITHGKLKEFEIWRRSEGAKAPTIRRDLACLSSMFETIITDWDLEIVNPVPQFLKKRRKRGLRESQPRTRYLTHEEEVELLAHAADYLKPMIEFAIDTGLRLEEQFSLTWANVSLERSEITIRNTKSGVDRVVPLLKRSAQNSAHFSRHIKPPHYVFHKKDGSRYIRVTRGLAGAARRAGIKGLTWHDLRRTCGCRLLQDYELSIEQVSKWLGHKSIAQTQRAYAFLEVDQLHEAVKDRTETGTGDAD